MKQGTRKADRLPGAHDAATAAESKVARRGETAVQAFSPIA